MHKSAMINKHMNIFHKIVGDRIFKHLYKEYIVSFLFHNSAFLKTRVSKCPSDCWDKSDSFPYSRDEGEQGK